MWPRRHLIVSWGIGAILALAIFYLGLGWLWSAAQRFGALSLESQVISALSGDLAEGNILRLGATFSKLQQDGHLRFAEIRYAPFNPEGKNILFRTPGAKQNTDIIFNEFQCGDGKKILKHSEGGINLITTLPSKMAGSQCLALFLSSDLPADLKLLKNRLTLLFALLFITILGFLYWLTLSWHKRLLSLETTKHLMEIEKSNEISRIAAQVAHDIRSPLAALQAIETSLTKLPEDERLILRTAMGRIRDIANNLLEKHRERRANNESEEAQQGEGGEIYLLSSLIEPVVTEQRLQFKLKSEVEIETKLDAASYGLFAKVHAGEFKRVISNLINNSVEAMEGGGRTGKVTAFLQSRGGWILLSIKDNGKGIPAEIVERLGQKGGTYGKAAGSGLGLYHAKSSVEFWGGTLRINSQLGEGTEVLITLPRAEPPHWFVSELRLESGKPVIVVDDDASIHMIWKKRFESLGVDPRDIQIFHFSKPQELRDWVKSNMDLSQKAIYLLDYEFLGFPETGLDLIEKLRLSPMLQPTPYTLQPILVTSRYEEKKVLDGCRRLGLRLIPKGLAGLVPISARAEGHNKLENRDAKVKS